MSDNPQSSNSSCPSRQQQQNQTGDAAIRKPSLISLVSVHAYINIQKSSLETDHIFLAYFKFYILIKDGRSYRVRRTNLPDLWEKRVCI